MEKKFGNIMNEKKSGNTYTYTKNCIKYVYPHRLGIKIPMALLKIKNHIMFRYFMINRILKYF